MGIVLVKKMVPALISCKAAGTSEPALPVVIMVIHRDILYLRQEVCKKTGPHNAGPVTHDPIVILLKLKK